MKRVYFFAIIATLLGSSTAFAQVQDHDGQFGLRAGIGTGLSYLTSYGNAPSDLYRTPFAVTAFAGYGLKSSVEIELGGIFSVERYGGECPVAVAGGVRYFYNPLSYLKFYSTLDAVVPVKPRADFGLRNEDGLQYDINSYIGLFLGLDLSVIFVRDFLAGAGLAAGVQGRY